MTDRIAELVEKFARNFDDYKHPKYNETSVRVDFVNPFWEALGWDVHNTRGYARTYRDVIHEDEVRVGQSTKAPDYSFRIGGRRIFFLETKKPAVDLKHDPAPAYQLRRYAYSAKLPVSLLTDFEEFIVYDTTLKPAISDKPHVGRMLYLNFREYPEQWEFLQAVFSKEAVLRGDFDRFIKDKQGKKPRAEIDRDFLNDLDNWRVLLARNIALRNPQLSGRELNYAVQLTIDRLIFLRMSEDRGIEAPHTLQALLNGERVYKRLVEIYYRADERYNSGLFHFSEKDGANPDTITPGLSIDDKSLKEIVKNLYYPDCPYEFSVLPVEVLGNAYEQFLGKRISLTAGHHARIEEKPEVRKAGGVYYTPRYIVDYIVQNTVGKLLEGKTPQEVSGLRILDPACGSGSFLLGAYQYFMDWHLDYYRKEIENGGKIPQIQVQSGKRGRKTAVQAVFQGSGGDWFLATTEKKRILLNNLYGVDIDANAVEVTKLSLLLKVLEDENSETLSRQLGLWHERALPNLGNNIKCGNSLIGPDYYDDKQVNLFDEEETRRINVFDWEKEFPEIFYRKDAKGFDAVIGNPPYIQLSMADYFDESISSYFINRFSSSMGRLNTYGLFIEKILKSLITDNGYFSFIVPNTILTQEYYQSLRTQILQYRIVGITCYKYPVFRDAVVETIVFVICNSDPKNNEVDVIDFDNKLMKFLSHKIDQNVFQSTHNNAFLVNAESSSIQFKNKLDEAGTTLGKITNINQAIALKYDRSKSLFLQAMSDNYKKVIDGRNINRYELTWGGKYLAYDVRNIHSCKRNDIFEMKEKIFFRRVGDRLIATVDDEQFYALNTLVVISFISVVDLSIKYLLGLINSKLINFYYVKYLKSTKKIFSEIQARQIAQLPIRIIDFSNPADKARHDRMVSLVEQMLDLHKQLAATREPRSREQIQRRIDATDSQIDKLVYQSYELTEEEIRVVEGS